MGDVNLKLHLFVILCIGPPTAKIDLQPFKLQDYQDLT